MIKTDIKSVTEYHFCALAAVCDNCLIEMEPVWDDFYDLDVQRDIKHLPFSGMLSITLYGHHGGHFDGTDIDIHLCGKCANVLEETFPCIRKAIEKWNYS